jgi:hypothetical protein
VRAVVRVPVGGPAAQGPASSRAVRSRRVGA